MSWRLLCLNSKTGKGIFTQQTFRFSLNVLVRVNNTPIASDQRLLILSLLACKYWLQPQRRGKSKIFVGFKSPKSSLLLAKVVFMTRQTPLLKSPKSERSFQGGGQHCARTMTVCTGVGKRLHILPSHPTLDEPRGLGWGTLTNTLNKQYNTNNTTKSTT